MSRAQQGPAAGGALNILVLGATGGTGRAVVAQALAGGHRVTAFVRDPARLAPDPRLRVVTGDAARAGDVAAAVPGHDAVVIALGDRPGPLDWLPGRRAGASSGVCATGTRHVLAAIPPGAGPRIVPGAGPRIVIVSAYGVGDTRAAAPWYYRLYLDLFLGPLMADKERQEAALKASDADFVIVQPVGLTDAAPSGDWLASAEGRIRRQLVARGDVAAFILATLVQGDHGRATVAFSG